MAENNLFGTKKPSIRGNPNAFFDKIKQIGESTNKNFTKEDGSVDMKKFTKFAKKNGVNLYDKSKSGILKFNAWFNKLAPNVKYDLVAVDKPGPKKGGSGTGFNTGETTIRQKPGTVGAPANDKIYTEGEKLNKQALKKFPKSRAERLKFIVDGLYKKFSKYQNVTKKYLTNFVKTGGFKMHPFFLMGDIAKDMMEDPEFMNSVGLGEPKQMTFNRGGMMDIDYMTRPLGYQDGGPVGYEHGGPVPRSRQQSLMEEEAMQRKQEKGGMFSGLMSIINNIRENAFAPEQREDGGAEYMKMFNFLWGKGYSQPQIDAILSGEINQEDVVPARQKMDADGNLYVEPGEFKG